MYVFGSRLFKLGGHACVRIYNAATTPLVRLDEIGRRLWEEQPVRGPAPGVTRVYTHVHWKECDSPL